MLSQAAQKERTSWRIQQKFQLHAAVIVQHHIAVWLRGLCENVLPVGLCPPATLRCDSFSPRPVASLGDNDAGAHRRPWPVPAQQGRPFPLGFQAAGTSSWALQRRGPTGTQPGLETLRRTPDISKDGEPPVMSNRNPKLKAMMCPSQTVWGEAASCGDTHRRPALDRARPSGTLAKGVHLPPRQKQPGWLATHLH